MAERSFPGRVASQGRARGRIFRPREAGCEGSHAQTLDEAVGRAVAQLRQLWSQLSCDEADIVEFQIELLLDDVLLEPARAAIARGEDPGSAFAAVMDEQIAIYEEATAESFRARAADMADARERVLRALGAAQALSLADGGGILVCEELTPTLFLETDWTRFSGAATIRGSAASHVAMLARTRGIPFLVGLPGEVLELEGCEAVLDAQAGRLLVEPDAQTVADVAQQHVLDDGEALGPAMTRGGRTVRVGLNVDSLSGLEQTRNDWFDGIGLARTELMIADRSGIASEEAEISAYRALFDWARGAPTTIRLLDAGGDKPIPGLTHEEPNPFMGIRGIRLLLQQPDLLERQMRSILTAAAGRPARILVPMVTLPEEMARCRAILAQIVRAKPGSHVLLGAMIEVPAAALAVESIDADFYSIGTNDLVQYVMAAARDSGELAHLHLAAHPAILELVSRVAAHGRSTGRDVAVCGDAACDPVILGEYLGVGVEAVSVPAAAAARVKAAIRSWTNPAGEGA